MNRTLVREATPGEIRSGLFEDGRLVEFRIARSRQPFVAGERYAAHILSVLDGGKALVRLDEGVEALLDNAPKLPEGARLTVEVARPPIPEPGRWKRAVVRVADDAETAKPVEMVEILTDRDSIDAAGFDELSEVAATGELAIDSGMLSMERTRAMTVIDVDGGGDPLALNLTAAREIPRFLRLLDIGGQIGIDFLALKDRAQRQEVDRALEAACAQLGPHERTAVNGFGFAQIVRPRTRLSIPEILCGTSPGRLSIESRAIALLREASRSVGHGARRLVAQPAIIDLIRQWPTELAGLQRSLGAAVELVPDSRTTGYGHVHVSQ